MPDNAPIVSTQQPSSLAPVNARVHNKFVAACERVGIIAIGLLGLTLYTALTPILLIPTCIPKLKGEPLAYGFRLFSGFVSAGCDSHFSSFKKHALLVLTVYSLRTLERVGKIAQYHEIAKVDGNTFYLSRLPLKSEMHHLTDLQIKHVFSFVERFEGHTKILSVLRDHTLEAKQINRTYYQVPDLTLPNKEELLQFLEDGLAMTPESGNALGHCKAGCSRSVFFYLAFLVVSKMKGKEIEVTPHPDLNLDPWLNWDPEEPITKDSVMEAATAACAYFAKQRPQMRVTEKKGHLTYLVTIILELHAEGFFDSSET